MTPEHEMIKHLVHVAGVNVKASNQLVPVFFLGSEAKKEIQVIGAQFSSFEEKKNTAQVIRNLASNSSADFLLFIAESYTIKDQSAAREYMDNMDKYNNSMSNHPMAIEIVMFTLETKQKYWTAIADILPDRKLGNIQWKETPGMEGTFANLLGDKPTLN